MFCLPKTASPLDLLAGLETDFGALCVAYSLKLKYVTVSCKCYCTLSVTKQIGIQVELKRDVTRYDTAIAGSVCMWFAVTCTSHLVTNSL